ncbi:hypothetical protein HYH03_002117 [Edaphochlamys debaryana]|uniref:Uncharacterized protein n=1 Tax=Edaphochlamys debaryana TaxID=47281 RepID=A0A836C4G8_9CHLO|nr:hypothetical protein HYH03_002117 [Edaphochlamys debaryana]|eukprot:KAG2499825.1 hypothetical protein HYH03_002117 [Edaphochlamys debaryana]
MKHDEALRAPAADRHLPRGLSPPPKPAHPRLSRNRTSHLLAAPLLLHLCLLHLLLIPIYYGAKLPATADSGAAPSAGPQRESHGGRWLLQAGASATAGAPQPGSFPPHPRLMQARLDCHAQGDWVQPGPGQAHGSSSDSSTSGSSSSRRMLQWLWPGPSTVREGGMQAQAAADGSSSGDGSGSGSGSGSGGVGGGVGAAAGGAAGLTRVEWVQSSRAPDPDGEAAAAAGAEGQGQWTEEEQADGRQEGQEEGDLFEAEDLEADLVLDVEEEEEEEDRGGGWLRRLLRRLSEAGGGEEASGGAEAGGQRWRVREEAVRAAEAAGGDCQLSRLPTAAVRQCLRDRWIYVVGDSSARLFYAGLVEAVNGSLGDPRFPSYKLDSGKGRCSSHRFPRVGSGASAAGSVAESSGSVEGERSAEGGGSEEEGDGTEANADDPHLRGGKDEDVQCVREFVRYGVRLTYNFQAFGDAKNRIYTQLVSASQQPDLVIANTGSWDVYRGAPRDLAIDRAEALLFALTRPLLPGRGGGAAGRAPSVLWLGLPTCEGYVEVSSNYNAALRTRLRSLAPRLSSPLLWLDRAPSTLGADKVQCAGFHAYGGLTRLHVDSALSALCLPGAWRGPEEEPAAVGAAERAGAGAAKRRRRRQRDRDDAS